MRISDWSSDVCSSDLTVTPSMVAVFTTLAAGGHQRAHRHNAAAITMVIAGAGVHMDVDGTRSDFSPWLVMITAPAALHSIANDGPDAVFAFNFLHSGRFFHLGASGVAFVCLPSRL